MQNAKGVKLLQAQRGIQRDERTIQIRPIEKPVDPHRRCSGGHRLGQLRNGREQLLRPGLAGGEAGGLVGARLVAMTAGAGCRIDARAAPLFAGRFVAAVRR